MAEDEPLSLCAAQWAFIKKTRAAVNNDPNSFFGRHNWRHITPPGGKNDGYLFNDKRKTSVDDFYVRPITCWVPHLLISNHVPTCPSCKEKDQVDIIKSRWINCPKVVFGITSNKYLDTLLYPCGRCKRTFAGYNKHSLQLDANVIFGFFNYYLGHGYAVDEDLYRMIVDESTTCSTATIASRLKRMQVTEYLDQYQLYLAAVGLNKVKPPQRKKQRTITSMLPQPTGDPELDALLKSRQALQMESKRQRALMNSAHNKHGMDISFRAILKDKENHNIHGESNLIPGIGRTKIERLISCDILSAHALLQADPVQYLAHGICHLIPRWQSKVEDYYKSLQQKFLASKNAYDNILAEFEQANTALEDYKNSNRAREVQRRVAIGRSNPYRPGYRRNGSATATVETNPNEEAVHWKPPLFSKFKDKKGYNGRVISKHVIDSIVITVFNHRKSFIEVKMMGLCAWMLKIDFNYKLASKIRVWTGPGQSFTPFKCLVTIQNEDGLTVFWKALKQSESFAEITQDLLRLRHRLNRNNAATKTSQGGSTEQSVKVVYVDNCCNVCNSLKRCFPGCLVKLDAFHWLKRWTEMLFDPKSALAGVFRALMSRALLTCGPDEFDNARERLKNRGKTSPTIREVMKEANTVIPQPPLLRANVEAVLKYCLAKDAAAERVIVLRPEGDDSPMPARFFTTKPNVVKYVTRKQMRHVDKGCLSDPPIEVGNIFRFNEKTQCCYVARGTNTNERDNLDLSTKILSATHIGIHRADRLMCTFFDQKNTDKAIGRLGEEDFGTYETERLLILNSYASTVGYTEEDGLPFPNVSAPTVCSAATKEHMGFSYHLLQEQFDDVSNPTDAICQDVNYGEESELDTDDRERLEELTEAQQNDFMDILADELDVEVVFDKEESFNEADAIVERELEQLRVAEEVNRADNNLVNKQYIQKELSRLIPNSDGRETTLQAFSRLAGDQAWIPFRMPDCASPANEVDRAEADHFSGT
jgi:hypothetical protein